MKQLVKIAETYNIFSNPSRLMIIKLLLDNKSLNVTDLTKKVKTSQSAVSQHLKILRQTNLVTAEKMSFNVMYSINIKQLKQFNGLVGNTLGRKFLAR
jgi:ArsR family transcriptional regulator